MWDRATADPGSRYNEEMSIGIPAEPPSIVSIIRRLESQLEQAEKAYHDLRTRVDRLEQRTSPEELDQMLGAACRRR